ncbi:MAG: SPOR domain-containing protein [Deltaproteobacteria bacterium]|nr:SPOR domain-containing protein [Deltaproteobacteria bacterium]
MRQRKINNFKTLGRRWGLYILISIWMFLLGVFVGRGMVAVQFGKEPKTEQTKGIYPIEDNSTKSSSEQDGITEEWKLGYYESLRGGANLSRFVEGNFTSIARLSIDANKTYDTNKTEKIKNNKDKKVEEKAEEQKEVFIVQAAAFLNKQDAKKFIATLKSRGYEPYESAVTVQNKVWHRVRIGPFKSKSEAENILRKLEKERVNPIILKIKEGQ